MPRSDIDKLIPMLTRKFALDLGDLTRRLAHQIVTDTVELVELYNAAVAAVGTAVRKYEEPRPRAPEARRRALRAITRMVRRSQRLVTRFNKKLAATEARYVGFDGQYLMERLAGLGSFPAETQTQRTRRIDHAKRWLNHVAPKRKVSR